MKENAFTGVMECNGKFKKGKLILEYKDGFNHIKLWEFNDNGEYFYYESCFVGKPIECPLCFDECDITAGKFSYEHYHGNTCTYPYEEALKSFKKTNPDTTKDWAFSDPYLSLENALAFLIHSLVLPNSEHFKKWQKEIGKRQDDIQRKLYSDYNEWVEMMEQREPGFTNY